MAMEEHNKQTRGVVLVTNVCFYPVPASGGINTWPRAKLRVSQAAIKRRRRDRHFPQQKWTTQSVCPVQQKKLILYVLFMFYGFLLFVHLFFNIWSFATFGSKRTKWKNCWHFSYGSEVMKVLPCLSFYASTETRGLGLGTWQNLQQFA